jgi:hypothetical protein
MYEELLEKSRRKATIHATEVENAKLSRQRAEEDRIRQVWLEVSFEFHKMIPDAALIGHLFYADALTSDQPDFSRSPQFPLYANLLLPGLLPIRLALHKYEGEYVRGESGFTFVVPAIHLDGRTLRVIYYPQYSPNFGTAINGTWYDDRKPNPAIYTSDFEIALGFAAEYFLTWEEMKKNPELSGIAPEKFHRGSAVKDHLK